MIVPKVAATARCLEAPLKQLPLAAVEVGVQGIQFDTRRELKPAEFSKTGCRHFLHTLNEPGLSVASLVFPTRRSFYDLDALDGRLEAVRATMQFAAQLRTDVVVVRPGRIPEDSTSDEYDLLRNALNDLARCGNRVGIVPTIMPVSDTPKALGNLLSLIDEGPVGISFDPAAWILSGQDPMEALRTLHGYVTHVQVRDALGDIAGGGQEVPVGRGEVPWDNLLALLEEAGYRGWLTVDRTQGGDKRTDAAHAVEYLRNVARG